MPAMSARLVALAVLCGSLLVCVHARTLRGSKYPSFHAIALAAGTDKVIGHSYHHVYDRHLPRFRHMKLRFLEIGLGCGMSYGPGRSMKVWYEYFTHWNATIDFLDANIECVEKYKHVSTRGKMLVGDQSDENHLQRVVDRANDIGGYDVIVDDGGHLMNQQIGTFKKLWPVIRPGGIYIIEDLQTSYMKDFNGGPLGAPGTTIAWLKEVLDMLNCKKITEGPTPSCIPGLRDLNCFEEACVFTKAPSEQ